MKCTRRRPPTSCKKVGADFADFTGCSLSFSSPFPIVEGGVHSLACVPHAATCYPHPTHSPLHSPACLCRAPPPPPPAAFNAFPDKLYCVLTLPHDAPEPPFVSCFTRLDPLPGVAFPEVVYLFNRWVPAVWLGSVGVAGAWLGRGSSTGGRLRRGCVMAGVWGCGCAVCWLHQRPGHGACGGGRQYGALGPHR